jgi:photosystem II stability/assembly factor-like uncharacterized protein
VNAQNQNETWQSIGPNLPTDSESATTELAIDPHTPTTIYVGSRAGVYKTTDGGAKWFAVNTGLPGRGHPIIDSLVIDPQSPSTLYAGISLHTEFEPQGQGVFKSTDGGTTWVAANTGIQSRITVALTIDPQTPSTLYALAAVFPNSCCIGRVYKTTDGGSSWALLSDVDTSAIVVDPQMPTTLYASVGNGVRKSSDGGTTWTDASGGLTQGPRTLAADPFTSGVVYAGTVSAGVFKTTDGGGSWTAANNFLTDLGIATITINPVTPSIAYAGTANGHVFKTTDGGASWTPINSGLGTTGVWDLAVNPQTPETLYASTRFGGVFKSVNGGDTWSAANTGLSNAQVYSLAIAAAQPARLYAGTFKGVMSTSLEEGPSNWSNPQIGNIIRALVADPLSPSTLYAWNDNSAGFHQGFLHKTSDSGAHWTQTSFVIAGGLAIDPLTPSILYAYSIAPAGRGVYRTTDGGTSWSFTGFNLPTEVLAVDPMTPTTVYAGTANGVFKTTDSGASWTAVNNGLGASVGYDVIALAVDPQMTSNVFVARRGRGLNKSTDGGQQWTATTGVPALDVYAIVVDPHSSSNVYAATYGAGVFKSTDGGTNFSAMSDGLTNPYVRALAIDPSHPTLYAGTDGSGVFAIARSSSSSSSFELSIDRPGEGSGSVYSNDGLYCGAECTKMYSAGATVTLTYLSASDSVFAGWDGCDTVGQDGTCTVTMDRAKTVSARFDLLGSSSFELSIDRPGEGSGSVESTDGMYCGLECTRSYAAGTTVTLTYIEASDSYFVEWGGCDSVDGNGRCVVTMDRARTVSAHFELR